MTTQLPATEKRARPSWFRFSIRQLLLWTAFIALACVALRSSTQFWISLLHSAALVALVVAVLLAIYRGGATRAYCIGFVVCGGLYLTVLYVGWILSREQNLFVVQRDPLITTWLSKQAYQYAYPYTAQRPAVIGGGFGGVAPTPGTGFGGMGPLPAPPPASYGAPESEFVDTAHSLWALLLAACGGSLARWLCLTRDREPH